MHCLNRPSLLKALLKSIKKKKSVVYTTLPLKQSFLTGVSKRQFTTGIRLTKENTREVAQRGFE